jgi:hypothetical protein
MDFTAYFYDVNCITTMNSCCDAQPALRVFEGFIYTIPVQHSLNPPINPCNQLKSFNP